MTTPKFRTAFLCLATLAAVGCAKTPAVQAQLKAARGTVSSPVASSTTVAPARPTTAKTMAVNLTEFAVTANQTSVPAGTYSVAITNSGQVQHELLVFRSDLARSALPMTDGNLSEEGAGVAKISDGDNLDAGKNQTREVDLSQPGTYLLICNLPGHLHAGMISTLKVT